MSDRTSAELFEMFFRLLAENPTEDRKTIAKKLWARRNKYDFSDCQMACDDELVVLGLARRTDEGVEYND